MERVKERIDRPVVGIALFSLLYNCILAYINHNITPLAMSHVVLCEGVVMLASLAYLFKKGIYAEDLGALLYLLFTLLMTIYVTVVNHITFVDQFRNVLIVFCFAGLGGWANERSVRVVFFLSVLLVLAFLLVEIISTPFYVSLFHPGSYFENTRGLKQVSFNTTGLFANALGFEGRFSFGLIDHRASSLFLEQVSLANFCGVLVIYLLSFWQRIGFIERAMTVSTIVLILLTNDTRTMLIFSIVSFFGYFVFPKIPKAADLFLMPVIVLLGFIVHAFRPDETGDNFTGRLGLTITKLLDMDISAPFGFEVARIPEFADSGYVYLIYGTTLLGFIVFWLFICLYPAGRTDEQRRCAHGLSLFIFLNMMIGGTAIFSMKIAGVLWLLVGFMRFADMPRRRSEPRAAAKALLQVAR